MKRLLVATFFSSALLATLLVRAQGGLYGAPVMLDLPQAQPAPSYSSPSTSVVPLTFGLSLGVSHGLAVSARIPALQCRLWSADRRREHVVPAGRLGAGPAHAAYTHTQPDAARRRTRDEPVVRRPRHVLAAAGDFRRQSSRGGQQRGQPDAPGIGLRQQRGRGPGALHLWARPLRRGLLRSLQRRPMVCFRPRPGDGPSRRAQGLDQRVTR